MAEEFRTPQSANEAALQNWAGADNELRAPQSRIEKLLLAILGEDVTPDPPQSVNEELLTQILEQGGGGGSGDFELVHTTLTYKPPTLVDDYLTEQDREMLELLANNPAQYCAFMHFTSSSGNEWKCPVANIKIPTGSTIIASNGSQTGSPRVYCSWTVNWNTNGITKMQAHIPTSTYAQTPSSSFIKIYKYK